MIASILLEVVEVWVKSGWWVWE